MTLTSSVKDEGKFLLWSWELWSIGGGAGVQWFFLDWLIYPGRYNPLWLVFMWQTRR